MGKVEVKILHSENERVAVQAHWEEVRHIILKTNIFELLQ